MTREQVKQELKELKSIIILNKQGIETEDKKGLQEKYDKAISNLTYEEQVVFVEHIYNQEPYWKIGAMISYSEEWVRKTYSKIIDKLANMLKITQTNFDKITSSVENLAEFIVEKSEYQLDEDLFTYYNPMLQCSTSNKQEAIKSTIKWLEQECENQ